MRQLLVKSLVGSGLVFGALTLGAQQYNPQQYQPRDDYSRYYRGEARNMVLNRVRGDLDDAQNRAIPASGDRWKIVRAKEAINQFQQQLNSGSYRREQLDRAIGAMQRLVADNRLPDRTQRFLANDVDRLRELQVRLDRRL